MMKPTSLLVFSVAIIGCTSDDAVKWVANFDPPPTPEGYTRYITPTIENIQPGANEEWCEWIAAPADTDQDVLALTGYQSRAGHHVVLYSTTETNFKVGEKHICTVADMISIGFIGGIGAEGDAAQLPEGLFFRLGAGKALMANTHWLNETDSTVDGQAVIDIKFGPASSEHVIADLFANNGDSFSLPSGQLTSYDVSCKLQTGLTFAMVADHMHVLGTSAYTELVHADNTSEMLVTDNPWSPDEQFNPTYVRYSVASPLVTVAGDTIHTHCEWTNTTSSTVTFPYEMCTGVGFYFPSQGAITCNDGSW
jgi:hypothetical protein